jgi:hypothetical protein
MRGRKGSRLWPPARAADAANSADRAPEQPDAYADDALLVLVRLLARQAAREVFDQRVTEFDRSVEEGRE